jgi:creatinine amidohydrolase
MLPEMTWEEVAEELKRTDMVIVTVGSTEEHGPHMPLAADTIQGVEVSKRIVTRLAADGIPAVVGPAIPFGISTQFMDFPGTISLSPATLGAVIKEICASLIHHGFRKIVLLVAHNENLGVMYSAVQELSQQYDARVVLVHWMTLVKNHYVDILKTKEGGHGGEGETARVLASIPELVRMERARAHHPSRREKLEEDEPIHVGGGVFDPPRKMSAISSVGCIGDPTVATAETGEKCYDLIVGWACKVIKRHFNLV